TRCGWAAGWAGLGKAPICRQAWSMGFAGWSDEMACLHKSQTGTGAIKASLRRRGPDGDHALGDCSSPTAPESNAKEPCRVRGNLIYRSGPGDTRRYMAHPARVESSFVRHRARLGRSRAFIPP